MPRTSHLSTLVALCGSLSLPAASRAQPAAPAAPAAAPAAPAAPSPPAPPTRRWEGSPPPPAKPPKDACHDLLSQDPVLEAALQALTFEGPGGRKPLADLKLVGLSSLDEKALWQALGGRPEKMDAVRATLVLRQLAALGVFASLTPVVELDAAGGPTLVITVVEHPAVRKVVIEGLGEVKPESLLGALLEAPSRREAEQRNKKREKQRDWQKFIEEAKGDVGAAIEALAKEGKESSACPEPLPHRDWLARAEDEVVFPGIVWKGLARGLERMLGRLIEKGYNMATLSAELGADGTLTVRIDEGRIARVEIFGVRPEIEPRVRELLGIQPGQPFVKSDLDAAVRRIEGSFPFLHTHSENRSTRARPRVSERGAQNQARSFITEEQPPAEERRWFTVTGGNLALHFKAHRFEDRVSATDLIRHTPVTNFAPGLATTMRLWDPADRLHVRLDLGGNVNTKRAYAAELSPDRQSWRFDWATGGAFSLPYARLAEIGVIGYDRVDTFDRWRLDPIDSYIYSILINRPNADYFRRTGLSAFATFHIADRVTAGVEYRSDRYRSLLSATDVFTIFNRDEAPPPTPPVNEGRIGSLILRLEFSTEAAGMGKVGDLHRDTERSIVGRDTGRASWAEFRTVNTLEIANHGLGSDRGFDFVRLVSDSSGFFQTGHKQGLKLRFRAAGKVGGENLPLQKEEALGGWSALRGYGFKEQRGGDFSLLGTAEYRVEGGSLFVDVGSLRRAGEFGDAKAAVGAALNFSDQVRLDFAWRADDQAEWAPEVRLLFQRTF